MSEIVPLNQESKSTIIDESLRRTSRVRRIAFDIYGDEDEHYFKMARDITTYESLLCHLSEFDSVMDD